MAISISIIIPVYNKGKYIRACIDSVLTQNHQDFEVIVINDGSTDDTLEILNSYKDKRLKIFTFDNEGVSAARNHGLDLVSKQYVTFVDGDDFLAADYLTRYDEIITNNNCDIVIGGITKTSNTKSYAVFSSYANKNFDSDGFKRIFVSEQIRREGIFGYVAAKFVNKDLIDSNRLRFDTNLKLAEDLDFWTNVYQFANSICLTDYSGYIYRLATEGSSIGLPPQHLSQIKIWRLILEEYAKSEEYGRTEVLHKINGICEAYFLELHPIKLININNGIRFIYENLNYLWNELNLNTCTLLQKLILCRYVSLIWIYLLIRKIRHTWLP